MREMGWIAFASALLIASLSAPAAPNTDTGPRGATVTRIPGVRYNEAYSSGSDPPGVITVNAGDAMKGTSIDSLIGPR